jgi:hypothetical protein
VRVVAEGLARLALAKEALDSSCNSAHGLKDGADESKYF